MIKIQCACGKRFNVPEKYRGQQGKCPNCATIIVIPRDDEAIPSLSEARKTYDAEALFEKVIDSVVGISDDGRIFGSGFFINSKGLVVTNRHVVGTAHKVKVRLYGGSEHIGELIRSYKDIDLAFLRIALQKNGTVAIGSQTQLKIGQQLFAIGHPRGLENSITQGIVSATNREVGGTGYIQTDASINPGNSGGPLLWHLR
jgi:S1-C subfamily serine protease